MSSNDIRVEMKYADGTVKRFRPQVFLINTKHPDGSPALCTRIMDDGKIELAGGEEFMVAFCPIAMVGEGD